MIKVEVKYNDRTNIVLHNLKAKTRLANRMLLEDIHRESRFKTPLSRGLPSDGDLREQVYKRIEGDTGIITWKVPYAQYQERGSRYDGSHVVKHYTTAGTGKDFAKNAVKEALKTENLKKYFKLY